MEVFVISFKRVIETGLGISILVEVLVVVLGNLVRPPHQLLVAVLYIPVIQTLHDQSLVLHHVRTKPAIWTLR